MKAESRVPLLAPLDGSSPADASLELAGAIAHLIGARIHVLFVGEKDLPREALITHARVPRSWVGRIEMHSATGDASGAIVEVARRIEAAAIVLSSHGATRNLSVPAGHVTLAVLADPPCPVYVVRSELSVRSQIHRLRHLRRILVPLDGSAEAAQSMSDAAELAERAHAKLLMLHVVSEDLTVPRPHAAPAYSDQYHYELEAWQEEFKRAGFARSRRPAGVKVQVALRCGDPGPVIAEFAASEDCDLIVAAWGGRLSPGRAAVIRALLAEVPCPLLFLRATPEPASVRHEARESAV
jgi:nucleotide-binding universal stress UspA family protein